MVTEGMIIFGITTALTGIIWGVRLEGRVNAAEAHDHAVKEHLKELLDVKFDSLTTRLERIERALNGSLHRGA